jgi:hypothetical protein
VDAGANEREAAPGHCPRRVTREKGLLTTDYGTTDHGPGVGGQRSDGGISLLFAKRRPIWSCMLRRTFFAAAALAIGALGFSSPAHAQLAATNVTAANAVATNAIRGLAVGAKAPAFKLVGQDGQDHALADLLLKGKLALVFQRSADW